MEVRYLGRDPAHVDPVIIGGIIDPRIKEFQRMGGLAVATSEATGLEDDPLPAPADLPIQLMANRRLDPATFYDLLELAIEITKLRVVFSRSGCVHAQGGARGQEALWGIEGAGSRDGNDVGVIQ